MAKRSIKSAAKASVSASSISMRSTTRSGLRVFCRRAACSPRPGNALDEIMIRRVVALPATATVLEACEFFVLYKFLAFPVIDKSGASWAWSM